MFDFNRELKTIAELGCNRGFITRHELPDGIEQYYLCDSSEIMLQQAKNTAISSQFNISTMQLDEEAPNVSLACNFIYIREWNINLIAFLLHLIHVKSLRRIVWIWLYQIFVCIGSMICQDASVPLSKVWNQMVYF